MKKIVILLMLSAMLLSLFGCGKKKTQEPEEEILPVEGISALTYCNSTTTLRFTKQDSGWVWADGTDFPLDDATVNAIVDQLPELLTLSGEKAGEDLTAYGLAAPSRYLTVVSDGETTTAYFGSQAEDGTWYMRTEDTTTVYHVADAFIQLLDKNIYDMVILPTMPEWTADTVKYVSIICSDASPVTLALQDGKWMSSGRDVTEKASDLLENLSRLAPLRCVDYKPADGAASICGLTEPGATITVKYENAVKTESTFSIVLGDTLDEGTAYYATLGESSAIYAMSVEQINGLLALADGHI